MTPTGPNAIGAALGLVGDEWNLLIVRAALRGPQRYGRLQHELGIAPSVLAARLASLTDAGVLRKVPDGARSAYELTRCGTELWSLLLCIWAWEQRWVQGESLPTMRHADCGEVITPCCPAAVASSPSTTATSGSSPGLPVSCPGPCRPAATGDAGRVRTRTVRGCSR